MPQFVGLQRQVSEMCSGFNKKPPLLDDAVDLKSLPLFIAHDCGSSGIHLLYMRKGTFHCLYVYFSINVLKLLSICVLVIDTTHCLKISRFANTRKANKLWLLYPEHSNTFQSRAVWRCYSYLVDRIDGFVCQDNLDREISKM